MNRAPRHRPDNGSMCDANTSKEAIASGQTARKIHSAVMFEIDFN
ncbi:MULTISPECIES: hypothetical protein [Burkholderiaceae]|jgi:hypothetical protein|uniref:Uncharacterized protein n=1 Tax=Caballeronia sordidicola TaxID=196367 RepID=A0A242MPY3_CABSO|nr:MULTISPECIES: hypothetical protein [Burkholderiaceae]OTP73388.1 hypothetical protein PAMC26510_19125 [Caballeronia sordidicola]